MKRSADSRPLATLERMESLESMEGLIGIASESYAQKRSFLPGVRLFQAIYPGLLVSVTNALASAWLSQHYGAPVMLFALLFGMAFHFLHDSTRCAAGIEFASRTILRVGVALLGVRITLAQIASLGVAPVATVIVGVIATILLGRAVAKALGLNPLFGVLSGSAVGICGASAALAVSLILPEYKDRERDTILAVVGVTALSTLAMILYPVLVVAMGLDHVHAGVFLGGTIHDVAQVVGAGYMISPQTGDIATYTKLLRVAMLVPVVAILTIALAPRAATRGAWALPKVPMFLWGFVVLVIVNSLGALPPQVIESTTDVSRWCLITAISALGMKTSFRDLAVVGWKPVGLMVIETIWIAAIMLLSVMLFL